MSRSRQTSASAISEADGAAATLERPRTESRVSFRVTGFACAHEQVTETLGIPPTRVWAVGDRIGASTRRSEENGWEVSSAMPLSAPADEQAASLIRCLSPAAATLRSIGSVACSLTVVWRIYGLDRPPFVLDPQTVSRLAELNAGIDLDVYNFE